MSREIKEEIREYLETNENKNTIFQTMGLSKSSLVSEVYRYKPTSRNKNNHKQPTLPSYRVSKRRTAGVQPRLIQGIRSGDGVGDLFNYLFIKDINKES